MSHQGPVAASVGVEAALVGVAVDLELEGLMVQLLVLVRRDVDACKWERPLAPATCAEEPRLRFRSSGPSQ